MQKRATRENHRHARERLAKFTDSSLLLTSSETVVATRYLYLCATQTPLINGFDRLRVLSRVCGVTIIIFGYTGDDSLKKC